MKKYLLEKNIVTTLFVVLLSFSTHALSLSAEEVRSVCSNSSPQMCFSAAIQLAKQGDPEAQFNVGAMYGNGIGTEKNLDQSIYWYGKSAAKGYVKSQYNLGSIYSSEKNILDYHKSVYWYSKAAEQGHVSAQFNLGNKFYQGHGVVQDYKQAAYWYGKSAENGYSVAQYNLGVMYDDGVGVKQSNEQAMYWYKKAAEQGHKNAIKNLSIMRQKAN